MTNTHTNISKAGSLKGLADKQVSQSLAFWMFKF